MPCRSDHLEPTAYEMYAARTAQCLCYLKRRLGLQPTEEELHNQNANNYPTREFGERATALLCSLVRNLSDDQLAHIVYDGRNPGARQLADWWQEHERVDNERLAAEQEAARIHAEQAQIRSMLSEGQIQIIRQHGI